MTEDRRDQRTDEPRTTAGGFKDGEPLEGGGGDHGTTPRPDTGDGEATGAERQRLDQQDRTRV